MEKVKREIEENSSDPLVDKDEKSVTDPNVDENDGKQNPTELGELPIEVANNSFVKMIEDLSQKQMEGEKPMKRRASMEENKNKKLKVLELSKI